MFCNSEFLELRRSAIGASDVAAILGLSPWKTPLAVYLSKVNPPSSEPLNSRAEWGLRLEDAVAKALEAAIGEPLQPSARLIHKRYDYRAATPDRFTGMGYPVELKTASSADGWGESGSSSIPVHYWIQVQEQIEVLHSFESSIDSAVVAVLIAGSDFRWYRIQRDPEYSGLVADKLAEFWRRVQRREPPEPELAFDCDRDEINRRAPKPGEVADLSQLEDLVAKYAELKAAAIEAGNQADLIRSQITYAMGEAEVATAGRFAIKRTKVARKPFHVAASTYYRFDVKGGL